MKILRGVFAAGILLSIAAVVTFDLFDRPHARSKRNEVAARVASLNEKYESSRRLALCDELIALNRGSGQSNGAIIKKIVDSLGEPQMNDYSCDASYLMCGWIVGAREGDRTLDPYASDYFVRYLVFEHHVGRPPDVEFREEHFPKTPAETP